MKLNWLIRSRRKTKTKQNGLDSVFLPLKCVCVCAIWLVCLSFAIGFRWNREGSRELWIFHVSSNKSVKLSGQRVRRTAVVPSTRMQIYGGETEKKRTSKILEGWWTAEFRFDAARMRYKPSSFVSLNLYLCAAHWASEPSLFTKWKCVGERSSPKQSTYRHTHTECQRERIIWKWWVCVLAMMKLIGAVTLSFALLFRSCTYRFSPGDEFSQFSVQGKDRKHSPKTAQSAPAVRASFETSSAQ